MVCNLTDLKIKDAKGENWFEISKLVLKYFPQHFTFVFFRKFYEESLVAKKNGKIVGYVNTMNSLVLGKHPYINFLCVDKKYRGQGIGKALLKKLIARLEKNHEKVFLRVSWHKSKLIPFYKKLGFKFARYTVLPPGYLMSLEF